MMIGVKSPIDTKHINLFHVSEDLGVFCEAKIEEMKLNA